MPYKRKGGFPVDALYGGLRVIQLCWLSRCLPLELRQNLFRRFAPVENALKEIHFAGFFRYRGRAPKSEVFPCGTQVICCLGKLTQQAFSSLRGQPVRNP